MSSQTPTPEQQERIDMMQFDAEQARMQCLELAIELCNGSSNHTQTLKIAHHFYEFVKTGVNTATVVTPAPLAAVFNNTGNISKLNPAAPATYGPVLNPPATYTTEHPRYTDKD